MLGIYAIFDRVAGIYGDIFVAQKKELAIRKFRYLLQNSPMVASDCDLFLLASYDTETGVVTPCANPEFVDRLPNE